MRVAIDDEEAVEELQFEPATVLTKSEYGYSWTRTKRSAYIVDFANLAVYLEWSQQFYGIQTIEAWLEADNTPILFLRTLVEPDTPDD